MHQSIATIQSPEFINLQPLDINPLMSKCEIKVLYIGQNRNQSLITKEVATDMAKTLRGAPIVGYYKEDKEDFRDHGDKVVIEDGEVKFECQTRPYGFVSPDAQVWFKEFEDTDEFGNKEVREYLMTTGYLWTGQYEEVQKVVNEGRPQSMELDSESLDGRWAEDKNSGIDFFIINDAIFSKLCILGDDVEPCFEGSSVTAPQVSSSFTAVDDSFKNTLFSMLEELKFALKGGNEMSNVDEKTTDASQFAKDEEEKKNTSTDESKEVDTQGKTEEEDTKEESNEETKEEEKEETKASTKHAKEDEEEEFSADDEDEEDFEAKEDEEEAKKEDEDEEDTSAVEKSAKAEDEEEKSDDSEEEDEEDKDQKYALLEEEVSKLQKENEALLEFKKKVERKEKEALIKQFSVILAEEDLEDVKQNIDEYSYEDIESKLSVTCVRKKVSFDSIDEEDSTSTKETEDVTSYTITDDDVASSTPAWVKSVRRTQEEKQ